MNPSLLLPKRPARFSDEHDPVRIVMICEDDACAGCARNFAGEVLDGNGGGITRFWNFEVLCLTDVCDAAASAAAVADFVVFSASGKRELSSGMRDWLETWECRIDEKTPALVAFFNDSNSGGRAAGNIRTGLHAIAERHCMEFVAFNLDPASCQQSVGPAVYSRRPHECSNRGEIES